jgi:hypothetical protein
MSWLFGVANILLAKEPIYTVRPRLVGAIRY